MQCEICEEGGYDREDMMIDMNTRKFVGPCCAPGLGTPEISEDDLEYGVEFSSKNGVVAFISAGGLMLSFQRRPEDIKRWFGHPTSKKLGQMKMKKKRIVTIPSSETKH